MPNPFDRDKWEEERDERTLTFSGIWLTADGSTAIVSERLDHGWLGTVGGRLARWDEHGDCGTEPGWNLKERVRNAESYQMAAKGGK